MGNGDKQPERFACVGCGHEHSERPKNNECENCGHPRVVDLHEPGHEDLKAASHALQGDGLHVVLRNLVVIGVLVAAVATILYLSNVYVVSHHAEATCISSLALDGPPRQLGAYRALVTPAIEKCLGPTPTTTATFTINWKRTSADLQINRNVGDVPGTRACVAKALEGITVPLPQGQWFEGVLRASLCRNEPLRLELNW